MLKIHITFIKKKSILQSISLMHFFTTGMFDSSNGVEHAVNAGNSQSGDRHDRKPPRTDRKDFTSGVVGVSINRQGSSDEPGMDETDNLYVEDVSLHIY